MLIVGGLASALAILAALILLVTAGPVQAGSTQVGATKPTPATGAFLPLAGPPAGQRGSAPPVPDWVKELMSQGKLYTNANLITKLATTAETVRSADASIVFNGERISYTLIITNSRPTSLTNILILDVLPEDTLDSVQCAGNCEKIVEEREIPEPLGGTIVVTATRQISWSVDSLAPGASIEMEFWGRVMGQADGTIFRNRAFMSYEQEGVPKSASSNETQTTVRVRVEQKGKASLSAAPTWFSADLGGTLSQDWGDFDHDGDLDLALGSSVGTSVYRNDQGHLTWLWGNSRLTYGVSWANVITASGTLELVAVGESANNTALTPGTNYIYSYNPADEVFEEAAVFNSNYQLLRVAAGDYDRDGDLDLVVSTNAIHPTWPVRLYRNQGGFTGPGEGISSHASASVAPGDTENDDDLDLALGRFPNLTQLLVNDGGGFTTSLTVDSSTIFLPYDFAWGDYDGDGYLDLAAAFPLERKVRVYHNQQGDGFKFLKEIRTNLFHTPLSIDWGDFNGDGRLDLAVADSPPRIYQYVNGAFAEIMSLPAGAVTGRIWSIRGVDADNDGDLDLALANQHGSSQIFTNFSPFLTTTLAPVAQSPASSVAWGDADGDGTLDLLFGAGPPGDPAAFDSKLYYNEHGTFSEDPERFAGFGPHDVAFGDVDGNGSLDVALGSTAENEVYLAGNTSWPDWTSGPTHPSYSLAWGDADDDGDLDLLVGNNGPNNLYVNQGAQLSTNPAWTSAETDNTRAVAWGDYNNDRYLDFAVGNYGQANQVYCNNGDNTFTLVWTSPYTSATTSIAWADYDGDGDLDLTVGNDGEPNLIYSNQTCQDQTCGKLPFPKKPCQGSDSSLSQTPIWSSPEISHTTSLAWGDWDNDGDLDLAVGNDGQPDQVYANLHSRPGLPQLVWLWTSAEAYRTSGVAWGDQDGDGDLDLAISQQGDGQNGVYENSYVTPSHLTDDFAQTMPLPDNPSYLVIERPGHTDDAFFFSSAELLSGPTNPTVTIHYRQFDPDGTRDSPGPNGSDEMGNPIARTLYEFSLDGGGTWYSATQAATWPGSVVTTTRLGQPATFVWDAQKDQAISDDARFRVCIVPHSQTGPVQRASTCAISPPFRIRGLTCEWPANPSIVVRTPDFEPGKPIVFEGRVTAGSGTLYFLWDFGDDSTGQGQVVQHTYSAVGNYLVTLRVRGGPCPITREVFTTTTVGKPVVYLPLILKEPSAAPDTVQGSGPLGRGAEAP